METEKLIEYQERCLLYDLSDTDYKNHDKKAEAWMEIAKEMGTGDGKHWSIKWKNLKGNYNKFQKSTQCQSGQVYKKHKNWPWSELLRFLDNFKFRRTTETNITSQPTECHPIITEDSKHSTLDIEEVPLVINTSLKTKKRKAKHIDELENKTLQYLQEKNDQKKNKTVDKVDHFFLSYAQSFKKLLPQMQDNLKLDIATLFAQYELQAAGETSSIPEMTQKLPAGLTSTSSQSSLEQERPLSNFSHPSTSVGHSEFSNDHSLNEGMMQVGNSCK